MEVNNRKFQNSEKTKTKKNYNNLKVENILSSAPICSSPLKLKQIGETDYVKAFVQRGQLLLVLLLLHMYGVHASCRACYH